MIQLPDELWTIIVRLFVERDVHPDERAALSKQNLIQHVTDEEAAEQCLNTISLLSRRHACICARERFQTVMVRSTSTSLTTLQAMAASPRVAQNVKELVYKVHYSFVQGSKPLLPQPPFTTFHMPKDTWQAAVRRVEDQHLIAQRDLDRMAMINALESFRGLQHIVVLQLLDQHDRLLQSIDSASSDLQQYICMQWVPACTRASQALIYAIAHTRSPASYISAPLSLQSAIELVGGHPRMPLLDGSRLTRLILHFNDTVNVDDQVRRLSPDFHALFQRLPSLINLFIGFYYPLTVPLATIFPEEVQWPRLAVFGIQGWKLNTDEVEHFLRRHQHYLKGLRLRDILLKEGSDWRYLLLYLRQNIPRLTWISLLRIGYARRFDEQEAARGVEILNDFLLDSDDEEELYDNDEDDWTDDEQWPSVVDHLRIPRTPSPIEQRRVILEADAYRPDFPEVASPTSPRLHTNGSDERLDTLAVIEDDQGDISTDKRKLWERWVLRKAPLMDYEDS